VLRVSLRKGSPTSMLHLPRSAEFAYFEKAPDMAPLQSKDYPEFITVTCLEWNAVLQEDRFKDIVLESLHFLSSKQRITIYAFVILNNHFHLIWQMMGDHQRHAVQRDFLKFTSQKIMMHLKNESSPLVEALQVNAKDRKYQVWERNSLGIPLWSHQVFDQKIDYIHNNPVKAGLCKYPEQYKYSSASFYFTGKSDWSFLVHADG
jgi:putative transposase